MKWLFDLDNTLYSADSGMFDYLNERINIFVAEKFNLDSETTANLRKRYIKEYGSTLLGLKAEFKIDPEEYLLFVHNIDVDKFIKREEKLKNLLSTLPGEKLVITNSPLFHAENVLKTLGIHEIFSGIYDIKFMDYLGKPYTTSIKKVILSANINIKDSIFIDDSFENVISAKYLGFKAIFVRKIENFKDYYEEVLFPEIRRILNEN